LATSEPGHAESLARDAVAKGADLILVLGGDGTINEAVQGLAFSNVPLGVLPGGTANVLAMELGLGSRLELAASRLAAFEPCPVALGRITGSFGSRHFLLMAGVGLDAVIVYNVSAGLKSAAGKLAYWVAGCGRFLNRVDQLQVQVDSQVHQCGFALISRVRNYGGDLEIASRASLRSDDFEVVSVRMRVSSTKGLLLEEGPAAYDAAQGWWCYRLKNALPRSETLVFEVTAFDRPQNRGSKTVFWQLT